MLSFIKRLITTLWVGIAGTTWANTMTNDEVIKLVKAGLSEAIILQTVDTAAASSFDTRANGLIALKQGGVTDALVGRLVGKKAGNLATATAAGGASNLASGDENRLAIIDGARRINIGYRSVEMNQTSALAAVWRMSLAWVSSLKR